MTNRLPAGGRSRAIVEAVEPEVGGGRFSAKSVQGAWVDVEADAFTDGHDSIRCVLRFKHQSEKKWREAEMEHRGNDRWHARLPAERLGRYDFTVVAWVDAFKTWRRDLEKRLEAGQEVSQDLLLGADLVEEAAGRAEGLDRRSLEKWAGALRFLADGQVNGPGSRALSSDLADLMALYPDRSRATTYDRELSAWVDRKRADFSAWYELFPRSTADEPGRHGTFEDVEELLPRIRRMGFDVVYLPPIHPIGKTKRKGPNNRVTAQPGDPGSPWAIGGEAGGHKAIHPELGTLEEFRSLVEAAKEHGMEIALDVALQCSPDHPYVEDHPEWFRKRPDGSIQYAENPPKKYEDIYPFDFESPAWESLWRELASIFEYWIDQGVRAFRVDNPHTKPFAFWEWTISKIRAEHPDVIFLSEAFTRPKVMYRLAKLGFTQSYTYFTWRNTPRELREYVEELTRTSARHFFRPNFWPNTPDILHEYLQTGGRGAFMARLVLAATLSSNYGLYGPAYELMESTPREPGSEEYLDSEKYQIRSWNRDREDSLESFIGRINRIRREHPALQQTGDVHFHRVDNEEILVYSKTSSRTGSDHGPTDEPAPAATGRGPDGLASRRREPADVILVVVNFDPHHVQSGWVDLDLDALGLRPDEEFTVRDLQGGEQHVWHGARNYEELDPHVVPAHIFQVSGVSRTEADFEHFM